MDLRSIVKARNTYGGIPRLLGIASYFPLQLQQNVIVSDEKALFYRCHESKINADIRSTRKMRAVKNVDIFPSFPHYFILYLCATRPSVPSMLPFQL